MAERSIEGEIMQSAITMYPIKKIALAAHDSKKEELVEWAKFNCKLLAKHLLYATWATAQLLKRRLGLNVTHLESGPLGGDQQIGSRITEGQIDFVIFFSDPFEPQPHDADVKALFRIAVVWNIPVACNRASADFIISSPLMSTVYERKLPDYSRYRPRLAVHGPEGDVVDASVAPTIVRSDNKATIIEAGALSNARDDPRQA
jgi:methylglyoxal synthase